MHRDFVLPPSFRLPLDGTSSAAEQVPVRDAATVLLVADRRATGATGDRSGVEVFTFRRVRSMAFAAGMLVFPGGRLEAQDGSADLPWVSRPDTDDPRGAGVLATAVRETFEECGVLIARPDGAGSGSGLAAAREALIDGRMTLADVLRQQRFALDPRLLHPWARWVTPLGETRRFDTRFYLARVPPDQRPQDLGGEGESAGWVLASRAVGQHAAGELPMLPPTLVALEELAAAPSVQALFATRRGAGVVRPTVADIVRDDGSQERVLRADLGGTP